MPQVLGVQLNSTLRGLHPRVNINQIIVRAAEMAQSVKKNVPYNQDDLNSTPEDPHKRANHGGCTCDPSTEEVGTGRSLGLLVSTSI